MAGHCTSRAVTATCRNGKGKGGSRLAAVLYMAPPALLKLLHPLTDRDHSPPS